MAYPNSMWEKAKALFLEGHSLTQIADATGISRSQISKRANKENWKSLRDGTKKETKNETNVQKTDGLLLDKLARAKYDEIVAYLKKIGKYETIDNTLVERYARAYTLYLKHYAIILKEGAVIESDKGNKYIHPANMIMQQAQNTMDKLEKQLGIGAYSRNRLAIQEQEVDEFLEFLQGKKK